MDNCLSCAQGFHMECPNDSGCCCNGILDPNYVPSVNRGSSDGQSSIGRPKLNDEDVIDARSTMRKRARAALKEAGRLHQNMRCEWRNRANCGLVKHPI